MTTQVYTDVIDHTSDAGFRAWAGALHQAILDCGLIDPGDSGQADFDTVPRPGSSTYVYRIYRFDDTQQGSAPVFIRIEYGTGTSAANPSIRFIVGQGSNGSGAITGGAVTSVLSCSVVSPAPVSTVTPYTTRVCVVDGCFWFCHGLGSLTGGSCHGFLNISRSVSSDGQANGDVVYTMSRGSQQNGAIVGQTIRHSDMSIHQMTGGSWCLVCGGVSSSLVGGSAQVYKHYINTPRVRPVPWGLTVLSTEFGNNTQFEATPVGAISRNYVSLGSEGFQNAGSLCALPSNAIQTLALVWE
jgi:hypothetical protein